MQILLQKFRKLNNKVMNTRLELEQYGIWDTPESRETISSLVAELERFLVVLQTFVSAHPVTQVSE